MALKIALWELINAFTLTIYGAICGWGFFDRFTGAAPIPCQTACGLLLVIAGLIYILVVVGGHIDNLHALRAEGAKDA